MTIKSRSRLAVIPARKGSKRIKNKNFKNFHGRPIFYYTLDYAIQSQLFERIHVSTDCEHVVEKTEKYGLEIDFPRPDNLADDYTTLFSVLNFVVSKYIELGQRFDEAWLLMPCAPLIEAEDLSIAASIFNPKKGPLIAVSELPIPISWAYHKHEDGKIRLIEPEAQSKRSQDLPVSYYDTGSFAIFSAEDSIAETFSGDDLQAYILPRSRSVDIDNEDDWELAEALHTIKSRDINHLKNA